MEYEKVQVYKTGLLKKAYASFRHTADKNLLEEYDAFCESNEFWLLDYCLFMAGKDHHNGLPWYEWEDGLKDPSPAERTEWSDILRSDVEYYKFVQFLFYSQWYDLKAYANKKGIAIIGDIPHLPLLGQCGRMGQQDNVLPGLQRLPAGGGRRAAGLFQHHGTALGQSAL